ncbi:MAG: T9SS type A sorting domain-containing protein [Flavobacteriales bacterium]|nr:T9SS type A sorting domain-containing protein [Flavobacteriales bacterium]
MATDLLTVTTAIPMAELTILDLSGRTVKTMSTGQAQVEMHVSDLPVGRYLLGVRMADGRRNMRSFMKQ